MTYVDTLCHICNVAVYVLYAMIYECNFAIGHNPWNNESLLTPVASIMLCYAYTYTGVPLTTFQSNISVVNGFL
jgi:hypothetical protein